MANNRKYPTPELMQVAIDDYFDTCEANGVPVTITGLTLHLGFTSRADLIRNETYSEEYRANIQRAKLRVEMAYEERLIARGNGGDIFALKNFDWTDKQTIDNTFSEGTPLDKFDFNRLSSHNQKDE